MINLDVDGFANYIVAVLQQSTIKNGKDITGMLLKHGWESWAQTEIGLDAFINNIDILREQYIFEDTSMRVDFTLNTQNAPYPSLPIAAELKIQNHNIDVDTFFDEVIGDMNKLERYASTGYVKMVIAITFTEDAYAKFENTGFASANRINQFLNLQYLSKIDS